MITLSLIVLAVLVALAVVLPMERQRRRATAALRDSEARFRALSESVPAIVWTSLPDGACDYVNQRWTDLTGMTLAQTRGLAWTDALHEEDREPAMQRWMHAMQTGEPFECEYRFRTRTGAYRWCLGRALPMRDADGRIVKWFGNCVDIEEHKRMEAALVEAAHHKDQFLATLAHELRGPLAPIVSVVSLLERRAAFDPGLKREVEIIDRQVVHLRRLVDDLLDASRASSGKLHLERALIDVETVVHRAVEQCRPLIDARRHRLDVALPERPILLYADATRLVQSVGNLLINAAKYTDPGGCIQVGVARAADQVAIRVGDNGIGIPPERLPHVFDMFVQLDCAAQRSHGGMGIGLALVRKLVELHGGCVEARSAGAGQGSEVEIRLPICLEQPAFLAANEVMQDAPSGLGRLLPAAIRAFSADDGAGRQDPLGDAERSARRRERIVVGPRTLDRA